MDIKTVIGEPFIKAIKVWWYLWRHTFGIPSVGNVTDHLPSVNIGNTQTALILILKGLLFLVLLWLAWKVISFIWFEMYDARPKVWFKIIPAAKATFQVDMVKRLINTSYQLAVPDSASWWDYIKYRIVPPPSITWQYTPLGIYLGVPKEYEHTFTEVLEEMSAGNKKFAYVKYMFQPYDMKNVALVKLKKIVLEQDSVKIEDWSVSDEAVEGTPQSRLEKGIDTVIDPASQLLHYAVKTGEAMQITFRPLWKTSIWTRKSKGKFLLKIRYRGRDIVSQLPPVAEFTTTMRVPILGKLWDFRAYNGAVGSIFEPAVILPSENELATFMLFPANASTVATESEEANLPFASLDYFFFKYLGKIPKRKLARSKMAVKLIKKMYQDLTDFIEAPSIYDEEIKGLPKGNALIDMLMNDMTKDYQKYISTHSTIPKKVKELPLYKRLPNEKVIVNIPKVLKKVEKALQKKRLSEKEASKLAFLMATIKTKIVEHPTPNLLTELAFTSPPGKPDDASTKAAIKVGYALNKGEITDVGILRYSPNKKYVKQFTDSKGKVITIQSNADTVRAPHIHVIGATGSGKSAFLKAFSIEALYKGSTVILLEPHNDMSIDIYNYAPDFTDPVFLMPGYRGLRLLPKVDLTDPNIHQNYDAIINIIIQGFRGFFATRERSGSPVTMWSKNVEDAISAAFQTVGLLDNPTVDDLISVLVDVDYRQQILTHAAQDYRLRPIVQNIQEKMYALEGIFNTKGEHAAALRASILGKLETLKRTDTHKQFLVGDFDFDEIFFTPQPRLVAITFPLQFDSEYIMLVSSFIFSKITQYAYKRKDWVENDWPLIYFVIDEARSMFSSPLLLSKMLNELRKFGVGIVVSHQSFAQFGIEKDAFAAAMSAAPQRIILNVDSKEDVEQLRSVLKDNINMLGTLAVGDYLHVHKTVYRAHAYWYKDRFPKLRDLQLDDVQMRIPLDILGARVFFPSVLEEANVVIDTEPYYTKLYGWNKLAVPKQIEEEWDKYTEDVLYPEAAPISLIHLGLIASNKKNPWWLEKFGFAYLQRRDRLDTKNKEYTDIMKEPILFGQVHDDLILVVPLIKDNVRPDDDIFDNLKSLLTMLVSSSKFQYALFPITPEDVIQNVETKRLQIYIYVGRTKSVTETEFNNFLKRIIVNVDATSKTMRRQGKRPEDVLHVIPLPTEKELFKKGE